MSGQRFLSLLSGRERSHIFHLEHWAADIRGATVSRQLRHQLLREVCDDCRWEELPAFSQDLADTQGGVGAHCRVRIIKEVLGWQQVTFTILSALRQRYLRNALCYWDTPNIPLMPGGGLKGSHHCCVQLLLNVLVYLLVAFTRVVKWEGLGEKQSGICTHLKVRSLNKSNRNTLD